MLYKLSVSKAQTFDSCRKKFKFNYVLRMKPKDFTFFGFGKALHEMLENFHKALLVDPLMTQEDQSRAMTRFFKTAWREHGSMLTAEDEQEAKNIIGSYLVLLSEETSKPTIIGIERNFSLEVEGVATLIGMIDRIQLDPDGVLHVVDYKSSKSMKYYEDSFFQLQVYAYVMMKEDLELQKIRGSYMFLKHKFAMITKEFSRDEIMKIGPQIAEYAKEMQAEEDFKANPSFLCNWCGFLESCPEGKQAVLPKNVKTGQTNWT